MGLFFFPTVHYQPSLPTVTGQGFRISSCFLFLFFLGGWLFFAKQRVFCLPNFGCLLLFFLFLGMACFWGLDFLFNDFAHMGPWEDGLPNFPFHPHNSKEIPKQKLLVKFPGAHLPGVCWKILRIMGSYYPVDWCLL